MVSSNVIGVIHVAGVEESGVHDADNVPAHTIDGNLDTRWSSEGDGQSIRWDLGAVHQLSRVRIAFFKGDQRRAALDLQVSADGTAFETVVQGKRSSGTTTDFEDFDFGPKPGRFVRYVGHGNSVNKWNSLNEVQILGTEAGPTPPPGDGKVVPNPKIDSLETSQVFQVFAGAPEQKIWTEQFTRTRTIHVANFAATGPVPIHIRADKPITHIRVSPARLNLHPTPQGRDVSFTIPAPRPGSGPEKLIVFVTTDGPPQVLYLLVDEPETNLLTEHSPNMRFFFAAGTHEQGTMELRKDDIVYLAAGALVKGRITASNAAGAKIMGRGILQEPDEFTNPNDFGRLEGHANFSTIDMGHSSNVQVEGITIRDIPRGWSSHYTECDNLAIRGVKIFSFKTNGDGIDPDGCQGITIEDCLVSTGDDAIVLKSMESSRRNVQGVHVRRCVLETVPKTTAQEGGTSLKIGTETFCPKMTDIHFEDCDIVRAYGDRAFSIINNHGANISDVSFTRVRVEEVQDGSAHENFGIHIDGSGSVSGITLTDITWDVDRPIALQGNVRGVTFQNCTVAGKPLKATQPRTANGAANPTVKPG